MDEVKATPCSRRSVLKGGIAAAATSLFTAQPAFASIGMPWASLFGLGNKEHSKHKISHRSLSFYHLHTGEKLTITYAENGKYLQDALYEINYLLRDFRTHEIKKIDPKLLDALSDVHARVETTEPYQIISGYRSPITNAQLHEHSHNVAQNSYHILGRAIDVCIPGRTPLQIRNAALSLQNKGVGGVGYYPEGFVHIDTGPVRKWQA